MEIVLCTDENYVMPSGIMICSLCENNREEEITFHIITDTLSEEGKKSLLEIVDKYKKNIHFYHVKENSITDFPIGQTYQTSQRISLATYYRLLLTEILPQEVEKAIYLDGDIIVNASLNELWNTDISEVAIGVVPDISNNIPECYNRLKYPQNKGYFNAGVLLINLDYWRSHNVLSSFIQYIKHYPERLQFHDQDVLNYVFQDSKIEIPLKYNLQNDFLFTAEYRRILWTYDNEIEEASLNPSIIHFIATPKPWHQECNHPYRSLFLKYKEMTEWKDQPLSKFYSINSRIKNKLLKLLSAFHIIQNNKPEYRNNIYKL